MRIAVVPPPGAPHPTVELVTVRTAPCAACGQMSAKAGNDKARELGREAARSIFSGAHGCWFDGLMSELQKLAPYKFRLPYATD